MGTFVCHGPSLLSLGSHRGTAVRRAAVSIRHWLKQSCVYLACGSLAGAGWVGVGTQIEAWGGFQLRWAMRKWESGLDPHWRDWWEGKGEPGSLGSRSCPLPVSAFLPSLCCLSLLSPNMPSSVPALSLPTASPSFFPCPSLCLHLSPQFPMDSFLLPEPILCPPGSIPFFSFSSTPSSTMYNWKSKTLLLLGLLIESGLCCLLFL